MQQQTKAATCVAVLNQKGGVGKSTLAIHLAAALARPERQGGDVLLIDADPQHSALDWTVARAGAERPRLFTSAAHPTPTLHREIADLARGYEYVVIDGPPRVTELARSVIAAAHFVLVPVQPSPYDIWAAADIIALLREARIYQHTLRAGIVINRVIASTLISREVAEALAAYNDIAPVLDTRIAQRVSFAESAKGGQVVTELDSDGKAAHEIRSLAAEVLRLIAGEDLRRTA